MAKKIIKIPKFLTELRYIWLFLASMLLVTFLFIIVYRPASFLRDDESVSKLNIYIFTIIVVFSAAFIITLSRLLLYLVHKKHPMDLYVFVIWLVVELLFSFAILTVICFFLGNEAHLPFSDMLWRVSLDFLLIIAVPYIICVLLFYLDDRRLQIDELYSLVEATSALVPSESQNINFYDRGGKLAFSTHRVNVLYIEAADNYCNIHYINDNKEDTFILHNSLKHLDNDERYSSLLRCHRGYMVNIDNVKLLKKDKDGLLLELAQGARSIPVSRSYNEKVVRHFAGQTVA